MYYKVYYSGFSIVNAESEEEAKQLWEDDYIYRLNSFDNVVECPVNPDGSINVQVGLVYPEE